MLVGASRDWPKLHSALASDQGRALQLVFNEFGRVFGDSVPHSLAPNMELLRATREWTVESLKREEMRAQVALFLWEGMRCMKTRYPYSDIIVGEVLTGAAECGPVEWMSVVQQLGWWAYLDNQLDWANRVIARWYTDTDWRGQELSGPDFLAQALKSLERSSLSVSKERRVMTWGLRCELSALLLARDSARWRALQDELQALYYALERESDYRARIAAWVQWIKLAHPDLVPELQKLIEK